MARTIQTAKPYRVLSDPGLLEQTGALTGQVLPAGCKICIVTDETVDGYYGDLVASSLAAQGFHVEKMVFAPGEGSKTMLSVELILDFLSAKEFTRTDGILALGGGVMGDLAGFAASVFLRGIPYVQVPTTFLAAVDSSVGGKTGVNLGSGKNLAGSFWQPSLVLFDPRTMVTLDETAFLDGLAETIKCGMIRDRALFEFLADYPWSGIPAGETLFSFVDRCVDKAIEVKQHLVETDEKDIGLRQLLNFGHTIGHAIELCSRYRFSHGHAVAMGMVLCARASWVLGWSEEDCHGPLRQLLEKMGFPLEIPFSAASLSQVALMDKKRKGDHIQLVVPVKIGECRLQSLDVADLPSFIEAGMGS